MSMESAPSASVPTLSVTGDTAINYAFQQNAIPIVRELRLQNDDSVRKDLIIRVSTEPAFAAPLELRLQSLNAGGEHRFAPVDLKLSHDYLAGLSEKVSGWLKIEVIDGDAVICSRSESISLLARNEWCGLVSLPEILAAFILPNDPAVMTILGRAAELLREHTGRAAFNGYQDKSRKRAWEQVAAIYKAIAELGIRYISPPASFENTGQKVRFPSDVLNQRFGTCLDLALLFAGCCEQVGLHPLVLMHEGHAYAGCWLEERTQAEPCDDSLQQLRKLATDSLVTVFETTVVASESPGTLRDAELLAAPHLHTDLAFRLTLDVRRARLSRIHPLPILGQGPASAVPGGPMAPGSVTGIGDREFDVPVAPSANGAARPANRIDQWKSRLLDLSLRNRLLNFKETKSTIRILSASPEHVEDELAAERELSLQPKPKLMSEDDPRHAATYTKQQRTDALADHLRDELKHGRLHTGLEEPEHARRLTELYRAARVALDENGTNTLFAAVGLLEWRETEHSDRVLRAPLLLVPVELRRKSVLEGFSLRRIDEESRLNVTLMEMLRQHFQKEIPGLDPLPEDESGVDVGRVFELFRDAVRELPGWEVKTEVWLGQFSFTKFLLWRDLADRLDQLTQNRIVHHLVHEPGAQYPNSSSDIRPLQLDDQFHPRDIFCPRSADSSQLAAVMAAAAGHDFVLEGPPGTGKSQTITNIIAHCLAHGKRVLFVAEKRAALDVVHRRLKEDGLEPFCLELHSNKIGKADVLAQFDRCLKFISEAGSPHWEHRASELERLRAALNDYARALHRRHPCGLSAYNCFDYLLPRQSEPTVRLDGWDRLLETSAENLERARELSRLIQERSRSLVPLDHHPLSALACEEWSPAWAERMLDRIRALTGTTRSAIEAARDLRDWLRCSARPASRETLTNLSMLVDSLFEPQPVGPAFATTSWTALSADLQKWAELVRERAELRAELTRLHQPQPAGVVAKPCESWSNSEADLIFAQGRSIGILIKDATDASRATGAWLQAPKPTASRRQLAHWRALVGSLLRPHPVGAGFATTPWHEWVGQLERWIALAQERAELRSRLAGYDEAKLLGLDLELLNRKWQAAQKSWFLPKWLRIGSVRRHLRSARPDMARPDVAALRIVLESALRLRAINGEFATAHARGESFLANAWNSGEPEAESLSRIRDWGAALHEQMAVVTGDDAEWLGRLRDIIAALFRDGPASYGPGTKVGALLASYESAVGKFDELYQPLITSAALHRASFDAAVDHLSVVAHAFERFLHTAPPLRAINAQLASSASTAQACLGTLWANGEPSAEAITQAHGWGEKLHARLLTCTADDVVWLGQARQLLASLFSEGPAFYSAGTAIGKRLARYRETQIAFITALEVIAAEICLRRDTLDSAADHLAAVLEVTERIPPAWGKIREWCSWQRVRRESVEIGLAPVVAKLESPEGNLLDIPALFERSFRRALLFATIEKEPALREFFGREHNERIERFRQIDQKIATLARELIQARLAAGIPRDQVRDDIPKAEIGLLRREIAKKTRHIPVRRLLASMPTLLPRLKPCVLMSPLSVAQYLEPSHENFDIVIFDEASQIPVWDAIGAIARGKQLIVVGDPKQLPPTNFFNSSDSDEDDLTPEEHKDLESILDELMTNGVRHKRLQWHYRSRHEGLIAFSNRQYYENDLMTFPSAETALGGVRFRHLPDARYDKGKSRTNRGEAIALVDHLVACLRDPQQSRHSYGVVTFSQAQQKLVEDLLDQKRREYPEIEIHFGDEPPIEGEPLIVKNLESVQGDERDVILFSICYGPDETGRVSMNFGPLNRDGGERRLNVAITRAKHEVLVFSGLRSEQIDLTRTRSRGVRDLKYFLDYADRGPKALAAATAASANADAESEFERLVAAKIKEAGYEVHHQVGCSGYRVDLGIVDPRAPGRYLLGVECDGATYHRAATARDRDKLRQSILEGLGWRLHRIWSTDWWHDAEGELAKLKAALDHARTAFGKN
jgi:very-short-patch-repair endonuclease